MQTATSNSYIEMYCLYLSHFYRYCKHHDDKRRSIIIAYTVNNCTYICIIGNKRNISCNNLFIYIHHVHNLIINCKIHISQPFYRWYFISIMTICVCF